MDLRYVAVLIIIVGSFAGVYLPIEIVRETLIALSVFGLIAFFCLLIFLPKTSMVNFGMAIVVLGAIASFLVPMFAFYLYRT